MNSKFFILILTICLLCPAKGGAQESTTDIPVEKRVGNCATMLGMSMDLFLQGKQPFDVRTFADTLYKDLYVNPVELNIGMKYGARTILQAFFALSEDSRTDYADMEKCLAVTGKHETFYTLPFIICAYYYSSWADEQGLQDKQIAAMQLGLKAHDHLYPDSTTIFRRMMNQQMSMIYFQRKEWRSAAKYTERTLTDMRRAGEQDSDDYYEMLSGLALCLKMSRQTIKADSCMQRVQQRMEQQGATTSADYAELLIERAELQQTLGNYDEAERMLLKVKSSSQPADEQFTEAMLQLAGLYTNLEQHEKALAVLGQMLGVFEKRPPEEARALLPWIVFCDNPLQEGQSKRFVALLDKMQDGSLANKAILAYALCKDGDYEKARQMATDISHQFDQLTANEQETLLDCAQPLYVALNDFDHQLQLGQLQLSSVEQAVGRQHDLYARALSLQASIYGLKGDYYRCLQLLDSCVNVSGVEMQTMLDAYEAMSGAYASMGEFPKSNRYASVLLGHTEDIALKHKLMRTIIVNLISELEIRKLDADEQNGVGTDSLRQELTTRADQMLEFCQSHFGESHINTIEAMLYEAAAYYLFDDTERMMAAARKCEQSIHRHLKNPKLAKTYLEGLSPYYYKGGDYARALALLDTTCLYNPKALFAEKRAVLEPLADIHLAMGNHAQAQRYFNQLVSTITDEVSHQMAMLTSQARQYYWRMSRHTLTSAGKYLQRSEQQTDFAGTIYNLAIYTKNILLGSEQAFVRAIRDTGDDALLEKMRQMINIRTAVMQDQEMDAKQRAEKLQYAEQLEKELLQACNANGYTAVSDSNVDWHIVQQALTDTAMAIEMVQYKDTDGAEQYGAVLLRKDWTLPMFVRMGAKTEYDKLSPQDMSLEAAGNVWHFAQPYLDHIRDIYFSPVGVFHKIPIEHLPLSQLTASSEPLRLYRLSSTSQLATADKEQGTDAAIYGGLLYDATIEEMQEHSQQRGAGDVESLPYLRGTKIEADSIVNLINHLQRNGMTAVGYSGLEGTETSFKALSGSRKRVIHIGTHGFFADDSPFDYSPMLQNLRHSVSTEDRALLNSYLCFAGADNRKQGELIPDSLDDGLLTAQEISVLDFRGLELVSLSACQTGQGHITSDGVFGLQRGFKKAGANSILMSLWKVDDEATCLLMTEFYKHWIAEGKTKHDALELAKQTVRSHKEKGWDDPKYWAAFILLDGLD